ncbi:MAG: hypothetical protein ACRCST_08950 [Turicibacter sp.]
MTRRYYFTKPSAIKLFETYNIGHYRRLLNYFAIDHNELALLVFKNKDMIPYPHQAYYNACIKLKRIKYADFINVIDISKTDNLITIELALCNEHSIFSTRRIISRRLKRFYEQSAFTAIYGSLDNYKVDIKILLTPEFIEDFKMSDEIRGLMMLYEMKPSELSIDEYGEVELLVANPVQRMKFQSKLNNFKMNENKT